MYTFQICWFGIVFVRQSRLTALLRRARLVLGWVMFKSHGSHHLGI